ncbi:MAG: hypothetical protein D6738_13590 [Acidobacteria bacterium]|nr:MAG: hypothetical protein D6738_13590 [Acidobacteriota bacterium]
MHEGIEKNSTHSASHAPAQRARGSRVARRQPPVAAEASAGSDHGSRPSTSAGPKYHHGSRLSHEAT